MTTRSYTLSDAAAFKQVLYDMMLQFRTALPGIIQTINSEDGKVVSVDVQPAIGQYVNSDTDISEREGINLPVIPGVPLLIPYSPSLGLSVTIPVQVGDDCLLVFCDRSIDDWQLAGNTQFPVENTITRSHALTDAICIPCPINKKTGISDYSTDRIEIRNSDASVKVSVGASDVVISVGDAVTTTDADGVKMEKGSSSIEIKDGIINIDTVALNINATTTTSTGSVSLGGITFDTHEHSDPQGGNTGPPQNP